MERGALMSASALFRILVYSVPATVLFLTAVDVHAQQSTSPAPAEPCLGYAYSIRPTPMLPSGIQTVAEVLPGTPAEEGGLRVGDLLVSVDGVFVSEGAPVLVPGDSIPFVVSRAGENVVLRMVVGRREPDGAGGVVCRPLAGLAGEPTPPTSRAPL